MNDDRLLRRLRLIETLPLLLKEAVYHRLFEDEENRPAWVVWQPEENHEVTGRQD